MENLFKNVKQKSKDLYISNIKRLNAAITGADPKEDIDLDNLDFLKDIDKVLSVLTTKYAPTTVRSYFISICSLLSSLLERGNKLQGSVAEIRSLYDKYYRILMEQNKSLERNNSKSETQKENWITQDEVLEKQKEYEAKAKEVISRGSPPEREVGDDTPEGSKKWRPKEWNVILDWVIISLYTLLPPRRIIDYSEMNVVTDPSLEVDEQMNYFVKSKKKFIFTNYKTSGTYKTQVTKVPDDLDTILNAYLDLRNDKDKNDIPLLITIEGEPIRENYTITKHLNKIFGKNVSVNMLRNIYLTTNFKENLTNLKETATQMGTSPETIQNHYVKLDELPSVADRSVTQEPIRSPSHPPPPPPVEKPKRGRPKKLPPAADHGKKVVRGDTRETAKKIEIKIDVSKIPTGADPETDVYLPNSTISYKLRTLKGKEVLNYIRELDNQRKINKIVVKDDEDEY